MRVIVGAILWLLSLTPSAHAAQIYTAVFSSIGRVGLYSSAHPDPSVRGLVRIFFSQPVSWNSGSCAADSAFIRADDKALIAGAQVAFAAGQSVQFFSDDTVASLYGICFLTYLQYQ